MPSSSSSSKARVLALSLDAADPALVKELAAAGEMPTMARLLRDAAVLETRAPAGVFVSANWPTIFTADSPDRHGYLCWEEIRGGTYEHRETKPSMVRGTPIWERLSEAGRRVAVLDVPHSLVRPVNGVMLCEWGCHDRHGSTASWPPQLADELTARHGAHFGAITHSPGSPQFAPCDWAHREGHERTPEESVALFEAICAGVEAKRGASLELLDRGGWDLFLSVMGESHCVGHQLWHLHDPSHPHHDPGLARRLGGDPVRQIYRQLDSVVADHLARLGPEDTAYVLLAHGMVAHHDGTHLLDQVLHRLDWGLDDPHGLGRSTRAAAHAAQWVPRPLRPRVLRAAAPLIRARAGDGSPGAGPPLHMRRWFMTPNNTVVGAVRLNLAGREPSGRVHFEDRAKVLRWLSHRLQELVNLDTGGPVVRRCVPADDVYRRTPGDAFGDLFVEWERSAPIERVWSPHTGTVAVPYEHWRQGDHERDGLLLASGPGVRPGRRRHVHDVADLGATLAAAAGLALPGVDGQAIDSLLPNAAQPRLGRVAGHARARLASALRRGAERRVPAWARRDPARHDVAELRGRVDRLDRASRIAAMAAWLPHAEVPEDLLISVVLPTRDRRDLLSEAIASVQAQSYSRWELVVVDDGSSDGTRELLAGLEDPRVRAITTPGVGVCGARNAGLDVARGDVIAYLDDDNRFDREWLKAVAMTLAARPDEAVCYGVRVFDDEGRLLRGASNGRPGLHFAGWDREAIRDHNLVDMNVLAHRSGPDRFDEELAYLGDWDLLLRLARDGEPVEIPAIAAYYRTDATGRLSELPDDEMEREYNHVRMKLPVR